MSKKMLIDASHAEETRVVVLDGSRIEEFDFESRSKKQLRGNIYLAKVTRVEPSLQAAFIEYGGNRHGFLAFNEIHPDYYQIPMADREALMRDMMSDEDDHHHAGSAHHEDGEDGDVSAEADPRRFRACPAAVVRQSGATTKKDQYRGLGPIGGRRCAIWAVGTVRCFQPWVRR